MASLITNPNEFSPMTDIMYGSPKPYGPGKKVPVLNKKTKRGLIIRCPWMLTYGAAGFVKKDSGDEPDMKKVSMSLQFPRDEFDNEKTREFLQTMKDIEEQVLLDVFKHRSDWLGNSEFEDVREMKALFKRNLKYPKDKQTGKLDTTRPPSFGVKIPLDDKTQVYRTEVFNMNRKQLYPNNTDIPITEVISKSCMVACNLYCAGIWFAGGQFGILWQLNQAMVKPSENLKKGQCYIPSIDEDGNEIEVSEDIEQEEQSDKVEKDPENHTSDGEDESHEVSAVEPVAVTIQDDAPDIPASEPPESKKRVVKKSKGKEV